MGAWFDISGYRSMSTGTVYLYDNEDATRWGGDDPMRTSCVALAVLMAGALPAGGARAQDASIDEPGPVNRVDRDTVEYQDDRVHVVAKHYYFEGAHDPRWLLVDVAVEVTSRGALTIARDDISIVLPDGVELALASQREYRRARAELLPMRLALHMRLDTVRDHFPAGVCGDHNFRFFVDSGIRQTLVDVSPATGDCLRGDLFFASPTGTWDSGAYALVIGGDTNVRLPIEIQ